MLKECHYNAIEGKVVKLLPHSSMIGMIFERDIHYRVVESNSHGLLQHDPFSWLVEEDHFVDVGDIYESQKIMNEALNEWILSLNEEQVRTFVETLYQVISASQADDLITFTADWKKSMNAVVTALKWTTRPRRCCGESSAPCSKSPKSRSERSWPRRKSPGADSEIRRKKRKQRLTGLFRKTLRMPLQPKDRQLVMLQGFGAAVIGAALNDLQMLT